MIEHDAYRQIGYIRQALSQNRKPIGVFLGAGCPLSVRVEKYCDITTREEHSSPIIQDILGLTSIIKLRLKGDSTPSACDNLVNQMIDDGNLEPNLEDILSQLRSLIQVAGNKEVRGFGAKELEDLDLEICKILCSEVNRELPSTDTPYHDLAIWARAIPRIKPVHIFTTNYDLLVEQALEESACPYFDGFIGSRKAFFDLGTVEDEQLLHARWCRLWKIHGSINWKIDSNKKVVRSDKVGDNESYLIYPSHLKYDQSRKMPYLAMLDRLKSFVLSQSSILFISGYSFGDDHINDVIVQGLKSNPTSMTFAFVYGSLDQDKYIKAKQCANQAPNMSLIGFDKGIIGRIEGSWVLSNPDSIGEIPADVITKKADGKIDEFCLGDFEKFGQFLREISSSQGQGDEYIK